MTHRRRHSTVQRTYIAFAILYGASMALAWGFTWATRAGG